MKYNNTYKKDLHELPSPEDIGEESMCFTVNINSDAGTLTIHPLYQALLQRISEHADVDMRYEFSKRFKLHAHGWLKMKSKEHILPLYALLNDDKIKSNFSYCLKLIFVNDKYIQNDPKEIWYDYCTKQSHLIKPYLRKMNINYHTQYDAQNPIGKVYKYITLHDELIDALNNDSP